MKVFNLTKKKIVCAALLLSMTVGIIPTSKAQAANDQTGETIGININLSTYRNVQWKEFFKTNCVNGGSLYGTINTMVGVAQNKSKVNKKYLDTVVTYTVVTPKAFTAENLLGFDTDYKGYAESLDVSCALPTSTSYLVSYPANVAEASSYSIGASASYAENKGFTVGVTGSTTITKKALEITNKSDIDDNKFEIFFNYKPNFWGLASRNDYLKNVSTQKTSMYLTSSTTRNTLNMKFRARFGYMKGIYVYDANSTIADRTQLRSVYLYNTVK